MASRMETFDADFDANLEKLLGMAEADLDLLKEPFQPMQLDMNPGAGIGSF